MGKSEMDGRCKRHPEHRQSKGVCPFCLKERLSHISATSSTTTTNASSTSSCSSDSNPSSSVNSPPHQNTKTTWLSLLLIKRNPDKSEPLRKSRSLAFVMREHKEEDRGNQKEEGRKKKDKKNKKNKKGRFWSKLMIGSDSKEKEIMDGSLSHSKTMKEKSSAKWVLF